MTDLNEIKTLQQKVWAMGDFSVVANSVYIVAEILAETVDLRAGQKVLDVATGSGNTAIAAARRWCEVTGIDFVPALLERGRERAQAERLQIEFKQGDAEELPFPDSSFDAVLSTFGVMFAPNQEKAAGEMLRVCKPGGKIGMANWTPDGFLGEMFKLPGKYIPKPPGLDPPVLWGTKERIQELFGGGSADIQVNPRQVVFRYLSVDHYIDFMRTHFGPTKITFEKLDPDKQNEYAEEMRGVLRSFHRGEGEKPIQVPSDYLEVVVTKK